MIATITFSKESSLAANCRIARPDLAPSKLFMTPTPVPTSVSAGKKVLDRPGAKTILIEKVIFAREAVRLGLRLYSAVRKIAFSRR